MGLYKQWLNGKNVLLNDKLTLFSPVIFDVEPVIAIMKKDDTNKLSGICSFLLSVTILFFNTFHTQAQNALHSFELGQVKLLPGVFKQAQETDMRYMLALDADRLLAPYRREAGLQPRKMSYGNWENTGLDGHIGGHYLSALSLMYAATGDTRMEQRLNYMLEELKSCQDKQGSGYLGGTPGGSLLWKEIAQGKIEEGKTELLIEAAPAQAFSVNIRYPEWVDTGKLEVRINGSKVQHHTLPGAYVNVRRHWKKGDKIEVRLPMKVTVQQLPDSSRFFAFLYGPVVLAAKTDTTGMDNLVGDEDQFGGYRAKGPVFPLNEVPYLVSNTGELVKYVKPLAGKSLTFCMPDLIQPAAFKKLELIPFYQLHDARYMLYWQCR